MSGRLAVVLTWALASCAAAGESGGPDDDVVERGAFRLHLYKRPTGRESYEIRRDGGGLVLKVSSENHDRGVKEPLEANLRLRTDQTPADFEVKGKTSRFSEIDSSVRVENRSAIVREGE